MIKEEHSQLSLTKTAADMLNDAVSKVYGFALRYSDISKHGVGDIFIVTVDALPNTRMQSEYRNAFRDPAFGNIGTNFEDQNYILDVSAERILVVGKGERGAFFGVQTLIQLLQQKEGDRIVGSRIMDYPSRGVRAIHMYNSPPKDEFQRRIRHFAHLKYTHMVLEANYFYRGSWTYDVNTG